ncbi:hypothetical protein KFL_000870200 [Klebsormidium nitens]|uniref:Nucleotide-diphospho-sugar transferase domain-containing protein n=1 Tax=Klebsormidium nitens TaxID=105231 RepID=A0A1Y1HSS7_KLENI|nr:hypothetical protein KFL_000870200 [Klebsormidium nitens]|eukprot:GAQ81684.1 hypothetical protein KFL_000870200 [Klebsormidium nitens]
MALSVFVLFILKSVFGALGNQGEHELVIISNSWWREGGNGKQVQAPIIDFFNLEQLRIGNASWPGIDATTLEQVLRHTANPEKELILTTIGVDRPDPRLWKMADYNRNFVGHLQKLNLTNYFIVGVDDEACRSTLSVGIPCWRDDMKWQLNQTFDTGRQVTLKWFYLREIVARGYHPIFLDNDAVVRQDPFKHWDRDYEVQALYDMAEGEFTQVADLALTERVTCPLRYAHLSSPLCASTGTMFFRATPSAEAFLTSMVDHLAAEPTYWEQEMFQTELLPYIVDSFEEANKLFRSKEAAAFYRSKNCQNVFLRFQYLPLKMYHNLHTMRARHRLHLSVDSVITHCGTFNSPEGD